MPFPGGGGGQATRAQQINAYAESLNSAFPPSYIGANLGNDFKIYMSQHPSANPTTIYDQTIAGLDTFLGSGQGLANALQNLTGTEGGLIQQIVAGTGKDLTTSGSTSGTDWQHLLVRLAEFSLGAILVAIGINALVVKSKTGQTVIQTAGTAARVVK